MTTDWSSADPAFLAAYGREISDAREALGFERKGFADEVGISYSYLSAIESGQKFPSSSVQVAIAEALSIDASELLARANEASTRQAGHEAHAAPARRSATPWQPVERRHRVDEAALRSERPGYAGRELSVSGTAAELSALAAQMSGEDRAKLLSTARQLAQASRGSPEPRRPQERLYRGSSGRELRTEAYLQFWTKYIVELDRQGLDWAAGRRPEPRSYFTTPSPIRGTSLSASFARNRLLRHELYINRGSRQANVELLSRLEERKAHLEEAYGGTLDFEDPGRERRAVRIAEYRSGHISRDDEFDDYIRWFVDRGQRLRRALAVHTER